MKNPRTYRWKSLDSTVGLLLMAQVIEESLFDYTLDTYRLPALNTHYRVIELLTAISHVQSGALSEKSLRAIVEELAFSLKNDPVAPQLLGFSWDRFSHEKGWDLSKPSQLRAQAELVLSRLSDRHYENALTNKLLQEVTEGKRKELITELTRNLVVEWLYRGFSRHHVYYHTRSFFFGVGGTEIAHPHQLNEFLGAFGREPSNWSVCFKTTDSFHHFKSILSDELATISSTPPVPRAGLPKERFFLEDRNSTYVMVNVAGALDAQSARAQACKTIAGLASIARCHVHRKAFNWAGENLVYDADDRPVVLRALVPPALKNREKNSGQLTELMATTLVAFQWLPTESMSRVTAALNLHSAAITSKDTETQLISLWSALESLLPLNDAESRIGRITELAVPILSYKYPYKIFADLHSDLSQCIGKTYSEMLKKLHSETNFVLKCAQIVCIDGNEPLRDSLYRTCDKNPLLRHRIYRLHESFNKAEAVYKTISAHSQRIGWHLGRIYRSRNLLVHHGQTLPYLEYLVENLHAYVDTVIRLLQVSCLYAPRPKNLNVALLQISLDHDAHIHLLRRRKKESCNRDNFIDLIFGSDAAAVPIPWIPESSYSITPETTVSQIEVAPITGGE